MHILRLVTVVLIVTCAAVVFPEARRQQPAPATPGQVRDAPARGLLATGTASIGGTVVVSVTGQPASGVRVSVSGPDLAGGRTATTDADGRFLFAKLPAGRYFLSASKQGHVSVSYGQRRPGTAGRPLHLGDGETRTVALQFPRAGVITGIVADERGEPAMNVHVRALRMGTTGPIRGKLQQAGGATTDDRGVYRIHSLQPGEYAVCTAHRNFGGPSDRQRVQMEIDTLRRPSGGPGGTVTGPTPQQAQARLAQLEAQLSHLTEPEMGYGMACFPGILSPGSTLLAIDAGEERTGIDLQLQPSRVARVEGTLLGMPPDAAQTFQTMLVNADDSMAAWDIFHSSTDPDGRFRFAGVPPGRYTLMARTVPSRPSGPPAGMIGGGIRVMGGRDAADPPLLWAAGEITVSGEDLTDLGIELQRGLSVSGQVTFHATRLQAPDDLSALRLSMFPVAPAALNMFSSGNAQVGADSRGRFTIPDLVPGTYSFSASLPGVSGWTLASMTIDGRDMLDEPLDLRSGQSVRDAVVTFTDQQTELSGMVTDEKGQPATEHMVLLYPAEERYRQAPSRRLRAISLNPDGTFTFRAVPPGEYRLAALLDPEPNAWFEPGVFEDLDIASPRVMLHAGDRKVQNVRVSSHR